MAGKFGLKPTVNGEYMFNLKAANGETVLTSERYTSKAGANTGIQSVRVNAVIDSRYEDRDSVRFEKYFVLKAANGEIIGTSEMYSSAAARDNGKAAVKKYAPEAVIDDQTIF